MCGIWAVFGAKSDVKGLCLHAMKVAHRGPDAFAIESIPAFARSCLAFYRLAIVGLSLGMQPMKLAAYPHLTLIFNGEIYNWKELGHRYDLPYEKHSDGEAIIHLYARFGASEMARMLDGIFAFCIVDTKERKVVLGRDLFGIKPLFTFQNEGMLALCSEVKGLIELPDKKDAIIDHFPPGHVQSFDVTETGDVVPGERTSFLRIGESDISDLPTSDPLANIRNLLKEAVKKRLMSDRPIGCLLSGGLDSSLVTALSVECMKERDANYRIPTFCIGLEGSVDIKAARITAKHLGTDHHEIILTPREGYDVLQDVIYSLETFDMIVARGSIPMYLISKYIREHLDTPVIMSGEGSDELFQGYECFREFASAFDADSKSRRYLKDLYLYDVLRVDRVTSAHGLELRVPFLDKRFTSYYLSLSANERWNEKGIEKHLLRKAFDGTGLLPDEILWRPKLGFSHGVSSKEQTWFGLLENFAQDKVSAAMLSSAGQTFEGVQPTTRETYYYRQIFEERFPNCSHLVPYYWTP